jgi:hypothetical protein
MFGFILAEIAPAAHLLCKSHRQTCRRGVTQKPYGALNRKGKAGQEYVYISQNILFGNVLGKRLDVRRARLAEIEALKSRHAVEKQSLYLAMQSCRLGRDVLQETVFAAQIPASTGVIPTRSQVSYKGRVNRLRGLSAALSPMFWSEKYGLWCSWMSFYRPMPWMGNKNVALQRHRRVKPMCDDSKPRAKS